MCSTQHYEKNSKGLWLGLSFATLLIRAATAAHLSIATPCRVQSGSPSRVRYIPLYVHASPPPETYQFFRVEVFESAWQESSSSSVAMCFHVVWCLVMFLSTEILCFTYAIIGPGVS